MLILLFVVLFGTFTIFLYYRQFAYQIYRISDNSMEPSLKKNQVVVLDKKIIKKRGPRRGDIIAFKHPKDIQRVYIQRLIAFGGEAVEIRDHKVFINDSLSALGNYKFKYYNEGVYGGENQPVTVPYNNFYVLGDNSAISRDSRIWGFVPNENIIGKIVYTIHPRQAGDNKKA